MVKFKNERTRYIFEVFLPQLSIHVLSTLFFTIASMGIYGTLASNEACMPAPTFIYLKWIGIIGEILCWIPVLCCKEWREWIKEKVITKGRVLLALLVICIIANALVGPYIYDLHNLYQFGTWLMCVYLALYLSACFLPISLIYMLKSIPKLLKIWQAGKADQQRKPFRVKFKNENTRYIFEVFLPWLCAEKLSVIFLAIACVGIWGIMAKWDAEDPIWVFLMWFGIIGEILCWIPVLCWREGRKWFERTYITKNSVLFVLLTICAVATGIGGRYSEDKYGSDFHDNIFVIFCSLCTFFFLAASIIWGTITLITLFQEPYKLWEYDKTDRQRNRETLGDNRNYTDSGSQNYRNGDNRRI